MGDHGALRNGTRAGHLIGQLGDPFYPRKLNALYYEFVEIGVPEKLGYSSPADMVGNHARREQQTGAVEMK